MSESGGPEQDRTRRIDPPTGTPGGWSDPDSPFEEGVAYPAPRPPDRTSGDAYHPGARVDDPYVDGAEVEDAEPEPRHGRDLGFGLIGAVVGILLTFVVIALATSDDEPALDAGRTEGSGAVSEAEIAERDEQIAELEAQVTDLESQLAATDLEADERNNEFDAQREALDERVAALDARSADLDERQSALDARERELEEREAALEDAGSEPADPGEEPDGATDDGGFGGIDLDDVDQIEDAAQGVVDRILDDIRDLFGRFGD